MAECLELSKLISSDSQVQISHAGDLSSVSDAPPRKLYGERSQLFHVGSPASDEIADHL